jgi:hypothetical protein
MPKYFTANFQKVTTCQNLDTFPIWEYILFMKQKPLCTGSIWVCFTNEIRCNYYQPDMAGRWKPEVVLLLSPGSRLQTTKFVETESIVLTTHPPPTGFASNIHRLTKLFALTYQTPLDF